MKIGIIGAGSIGKTLGEKLSKKGHQILIANSRGPESIFFANGETLKAVQVFDTLKNVDAVILTVPFSKVGELNEVLNNLDPDTPVIETTNYHPSRDGLISDLEDGQTHSIWVQEQIGRPVVKAFNSIVAYSLMTVSVL